MASQEYLSFNKCNYKLEIKEKKTYNSALRRK